MTYIHKGRELVEVENHTLNQKRKLRKGDGKKAQRFLGMHEELSQLQRDKVMHVLKLIINVVPGSVRICHRYKTIQKDW
jgi:hypothetical protein